MNWEIYSQKVYCNPLFLKGIVITPMNTIMAIELLLWGTVRTVKNSFAQWRSASKTGILLDFLSMACLLRKARTLTESQPAYNNGIEPTGNCLRCFYSCVCGPVGSCPALGPNQIERRVRLGN